MRGPFQNLDFDSPSIMLKEALRMPCCQRLQRQKAHIFAGKIADNLQKGTARPVHRSVPMSTFRTRTFKSAISLSAMVFVALAECTNAATVRVDSFYDAQDAVDLRDWNAAKRAIAAAGAGGTVQFTSGTTYTIPFHISPLASQTITSDGPGQATIGRSDALLTTLLADAPMGATYIDVADPTKYTVGYYVSPLVSGGLGGRVDGEPLYNRINSIVGNRIHLHRPLTQSYLSGDRVVNASRLLAVENHSVNIENLRFDGNRAGNDQWTNWATSIDVHLSSVGTDIKDVHFFDSPGGALSVQGGGHTISDSLFERINLAVVHFSASSNILMERNRSRDTNSLAEFGLHSSGAYEWSVRNVGVTIRDSVIEDAKGWAFGNINIDSGNSNILIENNIVRNNEATLTVVSRTGAVGSRNLQLDFIGNEIVDSGIFRMIKFDRPVLGLNLVDNRFWESTAAIETVGDAAIVGNRWYGSDGGTLSDYLTTDNLGPNATIVDNVASALPRPGDANLDGLVNRADAARFVADFGRRIGGNWTRGDFNLDGAVTIADLAILQAGLSPSVAGSAHAPINAVPEPSGLILLAAGISVVVALKRSVQ
jgi:hypothetical protein